MVVEVPSDWVIGPEGSPFKEAFKKIRPVPLRGPFANYHLVLID